MPTTARITGSVTIRLNETNGAYGVASQAVSLIINGGSTTTISLQAQSSGTANWSAASTWGSGGLVSILFDNSFAPIDYTNNVLDTPSLLSWQYAASGNPLSSSGPSDGTFVINNILSTTGTTPFGFPLVYSA